MVNGNLNLPPLFLSQHLSAGSERLRFAMQFALPPRKSSHAPPYVPRSSRFSLQRRRQLKTIAIVSFAFVSILFLLSRIFSSSGHATAAIPSGTANVVLVTVLDREALSDSYIQKIKTNRENYAARHGKYLLPS